MDLKSLFNKGKKIVDERGGVESGRPDHVRIEGAAEEAALVYVRGRAE